METLFTRAAAFLAMFALLVTPLYAQEEQAEQEAQPATIIAVLQEAGTFNTLLSALEAAEMTAVLEGEEPYTLFAPTDEAFDALPEGKLAELMDPENREDLVALLSNHIVQGQATPSDAAVATSATTLAGADVSITSQEGMTKVNEATVVQGDIEASNGVIHAIDAVLWPAEKVEE